LSHAKERRPFILRTLNFFLSGDLWALLAAEQSKNADSYQTRQKSKNGMSLMGVSNRETHTKQLEIMREV